MRALENLKRLERRAAIHHAAASLHSRRFDAADFGDDHEFRPGLSLLDRPRRRDGLRSRTGQQRRDDYAYLPPFHKLTPPRPSDSRSVP